ncbi:hypothetical protein ES703_53578 [subsurface metagenome]
MQQLLRRHPAFPAAVYGRYSSLKALVVRVFQGAFLYRIAYCSKMGVRQLRKCTRMKHSHKSCTNNAYSDFIFHKLSPLQVLNIPNADKPHSLLKEFSFQKSKKISIKVLKS